MVFGKLPDLILADGGITQIRAIKRALKKYNLQEQILVYGMVKDDKHSTRALIDEERREYNISENLFLFITKFQDEVHNTAIEYHRKLRGKDISKSELDDIPGIGDKRKEYLIKAYKSLEDIKNASDAELEQILPKNVIKALKDKLNLEIEKKS